MYKVIKIEDKQIPMMSNGGTLREYRHFFKRDMLTDIIKMETAFKNQKFDDIEIAEILENIAWVLAYKANPKSNLFLNGLNSLEVHLRLFRLMKIFRNF